MPSARITSNVSKIGVDTVAVSTAIAQTLSEQWGVPAPFMMVQLELEVPMLVQLNDEPAAYVHARRIGLTSDQKPKTIAALTHTVSEQLKVPAERVYVVLEDVTVGNWGTNGITAIPPAKK
ncbi:ATLS1-like light-inducible protein [Phytophthora cinnamomi]|uniref:ATLS1-like light-inducible protein n=1 Tax=Phytophthora cinnamomi TaxID=4785 RepID=UPI00355A1CC4|nr:ATLS1-like light-inducible protein [Phytophthora cinnamomi]